MKPITQWLLAAGFLISPALISAQAPQPRVRELATIPGVDVAEAVLMPNGRIVLYATYDDVTGSIFAYELASKRSTLVTTGFDGNLTMTRAGDRIAYDHPSEDEKTDDVIWTIPIDPKTGAAAGPAQRVTMGEGVRSRFSPDGKLLAFVIRRSISKSDLLVVPTVGGAERLLASYEAGYGGVSALKPMSWSADGKWIFIRVGRGRDASTSVERVPVTGGRSESVMSYSTPGGSSSVSDGGQIAFYRPDALAELEGRMAYVATTGAHGEFRIPAGSVTGALTSLGSLLVNATRPSTVHVLTVRDGSVRDLSSGGTSLAVGGGTLGPAWSSDGRRLAVLELVSGNYELMVVNADGSGPRRYPGTMSLSGSLRWSPKGGLLAYSSGVSGATVSVLDPATGSIHAVFPAPDANFVDFAWRPDGQSIVLLKGSRRNGKFYREVYEAKLDGSARKLRDIESEFPLGYLVTDRLLFLGAASRENHYGMMATDGGDAQKLSAATGRGSLVGLSNDGKWMLFRGHPNADTRITTLDLMTIAGDSLHTIDLPAGVQLMNNSNPRFTPDRRNAIVVGNVSGENAPRIFLVPLDGATPRVLATLPRDAHNIRIDLSPDGATLAFSYQGAPSSAVYELDLSPIVQAIGKR